MYGSNFNVNPNPLQPNGFRPPKREHPGMSPFSAPPNDQYHQVQQQHAVKPRDSAPRQKDGATTGQAKAKASTGNQAFQWSEFFNWGNQEMPSAHGGGRILG